MNIHLRYFAGLREGLGSGHTLALAGPCTLAELRAHLQRTSPLHAELLASGRAVRCALNQVMQDESAVLKDGDEVAFFPPVTGG